ncbi:hypothetical protein J4226_02280 [Candidatus Pacearchaeota archaeon]|nr:hypothetical protein [Candidatus Pacearchaeota archaeon]
MKNSGKEKITGLILKAIIITLLLFLIEQTYGQELSPEVVTTTLPEITPSILEQIERFYEISEKSLKIGYNITLNTDSAFQTTIGNKERYIIANNFSTDSINLIFIGKGETLFNQRLETGDYIIFKIDDLNFQFILHSTEKESAQVELKLFEREIPKDVGYFELFDIQVRLAEHEIYRPTDLTAMIEFTNFGEGPTHARLIYSITNEDGKELYTGIDQKIIETNEVMIKNFNTLKIPNGKYTITTTIYYGKNQEATSQETFILKPIPKSELLKQPVFFITIVLASFVLVLLLKKRKITPTFNQ